MAGLGLMHFGDCYSPGFCFGCRPEGRFKVWRAIRCLKMWSSESRAGLPTGALEKVSFSIACAKNSPRKWHTNSYAEDPALVWILCQEFLLAHPTWPQETTPSERTGHLQGFLGQLAKTASWPWCIQRGCRRYSLPRQGNTYIVARGWGPGAQAWCTLCDVVPFDLWKRICQSKKNMQGLGENAKQLCWPHVFKQIHAGEFEKTRLHWYE